MLTVKRIIPLLAILLIASLLVACAADPASLTEKGVELAQAGELDEAMDAFARALEKDPAYADAYYQRATVWLDERRFIMAAADLDEVHTLDPDFTFDPATAAAYYTHGLSHKMEGDLDSVVGPLRQEYQADQLAALGD